MLQTRTVRSCTTCEFSYKTEETLQNASPVDKNNPEVFKEILYWSLNALLHRAPNIYCAGAGTAADCDKTTANISRWPLDVEMLGIAIMMPLSAIMIYKCN